MHGCLMLPSLAELLRSDISKVLTSGNNVPMDNGDSAHLINISQNMREEILDTCQHSWWFSGERTCTSSHLPLGYITSMTSVLTDVGRLHDSQPKFFDSSLLEHWPLLGPW